MKVLLVEDDLDQLDITAYMLRRERLTVVEASDGAQALRRFKAERPDLVVVRLTPTEFRIFYTLAKNAGHVVPANRLFAYVWGGEGGAANSLRSHICHLRKKLGLDGGARGSIASVPAVGYVFRSATTERSA